MVTSVEFQLHPVGPEVLSGLIVHPLDEAPGLLREFRRIADTAPDELTVWSVLQKARLLPFVPAEWHGREMLVFATCHRATLSSKTDHRCSARSIIRQQCRQPGTIETLSPSHE